MTKMSKIADSHTPKMSKIANSYTPKMSKIANFYTQTHQQSSCKIATITFIIIFNG